MRDPARAAAQEHRRGIGDLVTLAPTPRQLKVHAFMLSYQREHAAPPTIREIADAFTFASLNSVAAHLQALEKKGLVRHRSGFTRGWIALELGQ